MSWIRIVPEDEAEGPLAPLYESLIEKNTGRVANVLKLQSLDPTALERHYALYQAVMKGTAKLSRAEREMIAVAVSQTNGCHY